MSDERSVGISLHGPGASIDAACEAGEAMKRLLDAVCKEHGVPEGAIKWEIASIQFRCDGCGLTRPDRPSPDEGWTYREPDDLCPVCSAAAVPGGEAK